MGLSILALNIVPQEIKLCLQGCYNQALKSIFLKFILYEFYNNKSCVTVESDDG